MNKYKLWIDDNYPTAESQLNKCRQASESMKKAFPELRIVRGFVNFRYQHWWCVDAKNKIVDPTAKQFSLYGIKKIIYDEIPEEDMPIGRCMNCGELSYYHRDACCEECAHELLR